MFAPRVLLKDFQEHNERIKSEKLAAERRHDEQISELKQAIAKVARESAQQIESLEAFVKGPFFSGLERKIQDSEKLAKDTLSELRRNTEEKFQAVEKVPWIQCFSSHSKSSSMSKVTLHSSSTSTTAALPPTPYDEKNASPSPPSATSPSMQPSVWTGTSPI